MELDALEEPLLFEMKKDLDFNPPIYPGRIPLIREDLAKVFKDSGIKNIQIYEAVLVFSEEKKIHELFCDQYN